MKARLRPAMVLLLLVGSLTSAVRPAAGSTIDGNASGQGPVRAGRTAVVQVLGRGGVPDDATAVVLNLTAVSPTAPGHVTVHRCDEDRPLAAHLNYQPGATVANLVIAEPDDDGTACFFSRGSTDLVADVVGYLPAGTDYTPIAPARLLDTRPGATTIDGQAAGGGAASPARTLHLRVDGRAGIPVDATAIVFSIAAVDPADRGFVTVHTCDVPPPLAASLNYAPGMVVNNLVIAEPRRLAGVRVCLNVRTRTHLVADALGYFPADSDYQPITAARLLDTRPGEPTIDGVSQGTGILAAGSTSIVQVTNRAGIPADAGAVVINMTATGARGDGYVTAHRCDRSRPIAATLSYAQDVDWPNLTIVEPSDGGIVCLYAKSATHLVADANGYFPASSGYTAVEPARLLDTRPDPARWRIETVEPLEEFDAIDVLRGSTVECLGVGNCLVGFSDVGVGAMPQIRRTVDGGASWASRLVASSEDKITDIECVSTTVCFAVVETWEAELDLARTADGGRTWRTIASDTSQFLPADKMSCLDASTCLLSSLSGVLRTTDGGTTWNTSAAVGARDISCHRTATSDVCFALGAGGIRRSDDGGTTWSPASAVDGLDLDFTLASSSHGTEALQCGSTTHCRAIGVSTDDEWYLVATDDGGASWTADALPVADVLAFSCRWEEACHVVGTDSGLASPPSGDLVVVRAHRAGYAHVATLENDPAVVALDCVGAHFCLGVTGAGALFRTAPDRDRYVIGDPP